MSDSVNGSVGLNLGVDIGGTKTAVGVVSSAGQVVERIVLRTPKESTDHLVAAISGAIGELSLRHGSTRVGVAVAALVDRRRGVLPFAAHLPLRESGFKALLEQSVGLAVNVENDATAAMWAEWTFGAAKGTQECVMVSVGTGVGGAAVAGGVLQRGYNGMAGEIGHQRFIPDGLACACGLSGCWEQYASGRVLDRWAAQQVADESSIATLLMDKAGGVDRITGKTVSLLAADGVDEAIDCLAQVGYHLGVGMASLASVLDPELFVVGGGLVETGDLLLAPARAAFAEHLFAAQYREIPEIVAAQLGPDAALIGAAGLATS